MRVGGVWWAVAGGWAIDLWLGAHTREHHDVEVVVRRRDLMAVHAALSGEWQLFCLDPPGSEWRPWRGHLLEPPAFQLQARSADDTFDIFAETATDTVWRFRRDDRVTRPMKDVVGAGADGMPVVCPEIQLLYMAKTMDVKNVLDFTRASGHLSTDAAAWLANALGLTRPGHPWIDLLQ